MTKMTGSHWNLCSHLQFQDFVLPFNFFFLEKKNTTREIYMINYSVKMEGERERKARGTGS